MKVKDIKQSVTFKTTPHAIYNALMDSKQHAEFSGSGADISPKIRGKFTAYDGYIQGKNIELVKDKKIVQDWRAEEEYWPENHYSKVTFELKPIKGGTRLEFTQTGVPTEHYAEINNGWHEFYWKPIKDFLEK